LIIKFDKEQIYEKFTVLPLAAIYKNHIVFNNFEEDIGVADIITKTKQKRPYSVVFYLFKRFHFSGSAFQQKADE